MKNFRTSFFNGYLKKDVDEYVDFLVKELDSLKEETARALNEQKETIAALKNQLDREQEEKEKLSSRLSDHEKKALEKSAELEHKEEKNQELEKKLKVYEVSYEEVPKVLAIAREKADHILVKAKEDAEKTEWLAEKKAADMRKKAEAEIEARKEQERRNYMLAKCRLQEYLDSLNATQSRLVETYNELGRLVERMPMRLSDVLSDEPMELIDDGVKKKND